MAVATLFLFCAVAPSLVTAGSPPTPAVTLPCRVISVRDGDTATVEVTIRLQVRLLDCWSPELKQSAGPDARDHLKRLAEGKNGLLEVPLSGKSRLDQILTFGRVLAYIWIDDRNLSEQMVADGHATRTKARSDP